MTAAPPRLARWILRATVRGAAREFILGDLEEEYRAFALLQLGRRGANRWYWSQALRSVWQFDPAAAQSWDPPNRPQPKPRGSAMTSFVRDVRLAFRNLRRTPAFATVVVITLALGIGATTAIFSAVNDVILRPLGYADPGRLVMLWEENAERGWDQVQVAPANAFDWRERVQAFSDVAVLSEFPRNVALTGVGEPVMVDLGELTGNTFALLGVAPMLGRTFTMEETGAEHDPVVILGYDLWRSRFGGDPDVVGTAIRLEGTTHHVVGVMGPDFRYGFADVQAWRPFRWTRARRQSVWFRQAHTYRAVARLAPGVSFERARSELDAVAAQLQTEHPQLNRSMGAGLTPLHEFLVGDRRAPLLLLLGSVGVLLLVACANVATLWLVRALERRREMAVRTALGASRGRIVRQLLTESLVIAGVGGALGLALGVWGFRGLSALRPPEFPDLTLHLDWRMFGFSTGVTLVSALLFGIVPALRSRDFGLRESLAAGSRAGTGSRSTFRTIEGLVAAEIALALVLVVGAALMVRTMGRLRAVGLGFDPENVLTFTVIVPEGKYPEWQRRADFALRLEDRLEGVPGVQGVGLARPLPLTGLSWSSDFAVEGRGPGEYGSEVRHREASAGYFRAVGVPLRAGRLFDDRDGPHAPLAVIINEAMAATYFSGEDPVGKRIAFDRVPDETSNWYTIIGVVGNERQLIAREPAPQITAHYRQDLPGELLYVVKTAVPPLTVVPAVREALRQLDPDIPLYEVRLLDSVVREAVSLERFLMLGLGVFAAAALSLGAVGVYGVTSQAARRRVREIGIRMALGASAGRIVAHLVMRVVRFSAAGVILGLGAAAAGTRAMSGLVFGISPTDPVTFTLVPAILATVALVAGYLPARRATRVDPMAVLKTE